MIQGISISRAALYSKNPLNGKLRTNPHDLHEKKQSGFNSDS